MRTESVTTLTRQATELLADLERSKQPILITQHGLPSAYLVDVETYKRMQQRMSVLEGIARGEQAVAEGCVVTHQRRGSGSLPNTRAGGSALVLIRPLRPTILSRTSPHNLGSTMAAEQRSSRGPR